MSTPSFDPRRRIRVILALTWFCVINACASREHREAIQIADRFTEARTRRDLHTAQTLLGPDPRIWWGERQGLGEPWRLEGGSWSEWDRHFCGEATHQPWKWNERERSISALFHEQNDYFRLLESSGTTFRLTYYLDDELKIAGRVIKGIESEPASAGRASEFEAWAEVNHPSEWRYLRPSGEIDPTGDRPSRTRALLHKWRQSVGLPPEP